MAARRRPARRPSRLARDEPPRFPGASASAGRSGSRRTRARPVRRRVRRLPRRRRARRSARRAEPAPVAARAERQGRRADPAGRQERPARHADGADRRWPTRTSRRSPRTCTTCRRRAATRAVRRPAKRSALNILVGDAKAGEKYLREPGAAPAIRPTGDLQGIATRIAEPKALQNLWVVGRRARGRGAAARRPPAPRDAASSTATVTLPAGENGRRPPPAPRRLPRDDRAGRRHAAHRSAATGDVPQVEIADPLERTSRAAGGSDRHEHARRDRVPGDAEMTLKRLLLTLLAAAAARRRSPGSRDAASRPPTCSKPLAESWPTYSGDYSGKRYSALTQINQHDGEAPGARVDGQAHGGRRRAARRSLRPAAAPPVIVGGEGPADFPAGARQRSRARR